MEQDRWQLDPSRFPRRLDLELPVAVLEQLEHLSTSTGYSLAELAASILSRAAAPSLTPEPPEPGREEPTPPSPKGAADTP